MDTEDFVKKYAHLNIFCIYIALENERTEPITIKYWLYCTTTEFVYHCLCCKIYVISPSTCGYNIKIFTMH